MMEDCGQEIKRAKQASQEVKSALSSVASTEQEIEMCRNKQHLTDQKIQGQREKINTLENGFAPKFAAQEERRQRALQEKNAVEQQISAKQKCLMENQLKVRNLEGEIHKLKEDHEVEVETLMQRFTDLREKVMGSNMALIQQMEKENAVQ